jgi:hypothetical protein
VPGTGKMTSEEGGKMRQFGSRIQYAHRAPCDAESRSLISLFKCASKSAQTMTSSVSDTKRVTLWPRGRRQAWDTLVQYWNDRCHEEPVALVALRGSEEEVIVHIESVEYDFDCSSDPAECPECDIFTLEEKQAQEDEDDDEIPVCREFERNERHRHFVFSGRLVINGPLPKHQEDEYEETDVQEVKFLSDWIPKNGMDVFDRARDSDRNLEISISDFIDAVTPRCVHVRARQRARPESEEEEDCSVDLRHSPKRARTMNAVVSDTPIGL